MPRAASGAIRLLTTIGKTLDSQGLASTSTTRSGHQSHSQRRSHKSSWESKILSNRLQVSVSFQMVPSRPVHSKQNLRLLHFRSSCSRGSSSRGDHSRRQQGGKREERSHRGGCNQSHLELAIPRTHQFQVSSFSLHGRGS